MRFLLVIPFLFPSLAFAEPNELRHAVARDIQGLLDDTVNEGEQQAHVTDPDSIQCRVSAVVGNQKKKWAFCRVRFDVSYEESQAVRECTLLYSFQEPDIYKNLERAKEDLFTGCIEQLGESLD